MQIALQNLDISALRVYTGVILHRPHKIRILVPTKKITRNEREPKRIIPVLCGQDVEVEPEEVPGQATTDCTAGDLAEDIVTVLGPDWRVFLQDDVQVAVGVGIGEVMRMVMMVKMMMIVMMVKVMMIITTISTLMVRMMMIMMMMMMMMMMVMMKTVITAEMVTTAETLMMIMMMMKMMMMMMMMTTIMMMIAIIMMIM